MLIKTERELQNEKKENENLRSKIHQIRKIAKYTTKKGIINDSETEKPKVSPRFPWAKNLFLCSECRKISRKHPKIANKIIN